MMIRRFNQTEGRYIWKILGQDRLAFAHSDTNDFYDLIAWSKAGGYQGSVLLFFDFTSGQVYQPFSKKRNAVYSAPVYTGDSYYFLQGDYDEKKIVLYRYLPEKTVEKVTELDAEQVNLYHLRLIGSGVHIVSQEEKLECYYPEKFSFPTEGAETVVLMEDGKVYLESWVEEGWDEEAARATDQYNFYYKIIVRDYAGRKLSEEIGALYQAADGAWWIA